MLNATSHKYGAYTQQIGKLNTVADSIRSFEVLLALAQMLRAKLKGSKEFLSKINTIPVVAQEGDKVGVGVKGPIASRYEALDAWAHQPNFQTLLRDAIVGAKARAPCRGGCSDIKAWTGHTTDSEVARYTAAADQRTLSDTAADKLLANLAERLAKDAAKALTIQGNK